MTKKVSDSAQQKQQWQIIVEKWKQQENGKMKSKRGHVLAFEQQVNHKQSTYTHKR